jgi:putative tryptophan/tyrosine transport system substrate-binding protein
MAIDIARREFILAFGGAAVAWPIAAGAQQSSRMRRMGLLVGYAENDSEAQAHIAALRETLQKLGWTANHDIQINERWASGDVDKMHRYAAELVARLGYRPSKKSIKRMVEQIHALTDRTGTWQDTTELVGK